LIILHKLIVHVTPKNILSQVQTLSFFFSYVLHFDRV